MKYVQIIKLPHTDDRNKYVLLCRNLDGSMSKACELDRCPTYFVAFMRAAAWNKIMMRRSRLGG